MSRSGAERGALLAALVVGLLLAPQDIGAQPPPLAPSVLDIRLPVLDLELTSSSLDDSVQTAESEREVRLTLRRRPLPLQQGLADPKGPQPPGGGDRSDP